jgi:DNA replication protein DnaC
MLAGNQNTTTLPKCEFCGSEKFSNRQTPGGYKDICDLCYRKLVSEYNNKHMNSFLSDIGVSKRFLPCRFENYIANTESQKTAVSFLKTIEYGSNFNSQVFITSARPGTGKTHLAVATISNYLSTGAKKDTLRFKTSPQIFLSIKSVFNSDSKTEEDVIRKYTEVDFLVIDDIGVEKVSDWSLQVWYMIIDERYSMMKPTLYTSNLSIGNIADTLGARIASRLSSGIVLTIEGDDYRLKNRISIERKAA